jgi:guanylate kinase
MKNILILITGPSGSGKSTIVKKLEKIGFEESISTTTREKRVGEVDQFESKKPTYYYVTEEEFLSLKEKDFFAETVNFNGNMYGVASNQLTKSSKMVLIVENEGQKEILNYIKKHNLKIKTIRVFLSISKEKQIERMKGRGDSENSIKKRILNDNIQEKFLINDYDIVINSEIFSPNQIAETIKGALS